MAKMHRETHQRTLVKTITYRVVITIMIFTVSWLLTGKLADAAAITGVSAVLSTIIYYIHERVWNAIDWGKARR